MKHFSIKYLCTLALFFVTFFAAQAAHSEASEAQPKIDVKEIVLGHMSDAYEWHITTWNGHHISIPLPVIVKGETSGWQMFSSARFHDSADGTYNGFYLNEEQNGKIYEHTAAGDVRPLDFSITKNVVQIWIVVILMAFIFIGSARWYKGRKPGDKAPGGFVGLVEMFVMSINDDLIRPSVGEKHYRQYAPFLLTAFFFIFITNLLGLLPIFPGGANITGNINAAGGTIGGFTIGDNSITAPNGVKLYSSGNFSTVNNLQLSSGTDGHHRDYAMLTQASGFDELRIMHSSGDADWGSVRFYAENGQAKVSVHSPLTVGGGLLLINLPTTTQAPNLYIDEAGNLYRCAS